MGITWQSAPYEVAEVFMSLVGDGESVGCDGVFMGIYDKYICIIEDPDESVQCNWCYVHIIELNVGEKAKHIGKGFNNALLAIYACERYVSAKGAISEFHEDPEEKQVWPEGAKKWAKEWEKIEEKKKQRNKQRKG